MIYKQQRIERRLPTCDYTINDLNTLIEICVRLHQDCISKFIDDVRTKKYNVAGLDAEKEADVKTHVEQNFWWMVEIWGGNGEYLNVTDLSKLTNSDLPHRIQKLKIGNLVMYKQKTSGLWPSVYFTVTIDFKTVRIFDLISQPSRTPDNESSISVAGTNSVTALGLAAELDAYFAKHKNLNSVINTENVYDLLLWIVFLPLLLAYLTKYHGAIPERILSAPIPIQLIFAIVVFFQSLFLFRLLFNFGRWFFPCQELMTQTSTWRKAAKYIYSAALTGFIGTIVYNFIVWLIEKLNA